MHYKVSSERKMRESVLWTHPDEPTQSDTLENIERLASIGKFTAKIAHELNGPLDGVLRYINLTLRQLDQGRTGVKFLARVVGRHHATDANDWQPPGVMLPDIADDFCASFAQRPAAQSADLVPPAASQPRPGDGRIASHDAANPMFFGDFKHDIQLRPAEIWRNLQ